MYALIFSNVSSFLAPFKVNSVYAVTFSMSAFLFMNAGIFEDS